MNFTEEDIIFVKKAIEIRNKGYYIQSQALTDHYNRILGKNVSNTTCSSCCRSRISELERALKQWEAQEAKEAAKKAVEEVKTEEVDNLPEEEKEENTEEINEAQDNAEETEEEAEVENVCDELVIEEVKEANNVDNKEPHKTKGRKKKQEPAG